MLTRMSWYFTCCFCLMIFRFWRKSVITVIKVLTILSCVADSGGVVVHLLGGAFYIAKTRWRLSSPGID